MNSLYEQAGYRRRVTQPTCLKALIMIYYVTKEYDFLSWVVGRG